jgi:16S rRNA (uracil1498-N3)-methyltransferase
VEPTFAAAFPAAAHVLVNPGPDAGLPDALLVDGSDGHHLVRVRRLQVGEAVTAADGHGQWRPYLVSSTGNRELTLTATGPSRNEPVPAPGLAVAFALTKGVKPETVVRQLTELGVDEILPVVATRSIVRPRAERVGAVAERLERVAREAVMQSRRARLPRIAAVGPLAALAGRPGLVIAERGDLPSTDLPSTAPASTAPASTAPASTDPASTDPADPGAGGWLLVVGPEGGLTPEDLHILEGTLDRRLPRLSVGPHILRAETAAVAAAAVLSARRSPEPSGRAGRS